MYSDLKDSALVLLAVAVAVLVLLVIRGRFRCTMSMEQRNLFATNYGFFSALYTFFLGFAVMTLWQDYNKAAMAITNEADALVVQYRLSLSFEKTEPYRRSLIRYVDFVNTTGWKNMKESLPSDGANDLYDAVWREFRSIRPKNGLDIGTYDIMTSQLIDLNKLRQQRLLLINGNLYPPIWIIIYLGVAFTIFGFYFLESGHRPADVYFMLMLLTMVLGNIFLLYELATPFSGFIRLDRGKFELAARTMRSLGGL